MQTAGRAGACCRTVGELRNRRGVVRLRTARRSNWHSELREIGRDRSGGVVSRHFDNFDAVLEFDALDDFRQLIFAPQASPCFRGGVDEFEHHQLGGLRRPGPLLPHGSMTHRREHRSRWGLTCADGSSARREVEKASGASRSLVRQATALSYLASYLSANTSIAASAGVSLLSGGSGRLDTRLERRL